MENDQTRPSGAPATEKHLRIALAALYRLCAKFDMTDLIYTHITARVPGEDEHFLINNFGVMFEKMRASNLVKIDHEGNVISGAHTHTEARINVAGFNIHSAVHMSRPDLNCVIHTHTPAGIAVAAQRDGLLPISQHSMMFYNAISYHPYESFAGRLEERERIQADLGNNNVMVLRNHGMLIGGRSIGEAFFLAHHLERACQAQVLALGGGTPLNMPPPEIAEMTQRRIAQMPAEQIDIFWRSCLTLVADEEEDYRL
ncbi:MAG TPA: class II aldolase/adducin family protein [Sphingobium sp.]|nr:class II aldolase/adducin family protein [Sphingobium sp.]